MFSLEIVGGPVVGRVDDDLAVPVEAVHGRRGHAVPGHGDDDDAADAASSTVACRDSRRRAPRPPTPATPGRGCWRSRPAAGARAVPRHRLAEPAGADDSDVRSRFLELGCEQVAHREAPVRPPARRPPRPSRLGRKVVEAVGRWIACRSARSPERKTSGRSSATSRNPCAVHGPMPGHLGEGRLDLVVGHARERLVAQASVDEPFRERAQRRALASREAASRSTCGSAASSSAGDGRCPPKRSSRRDDDRPRRPTESCWPATWKMSVPKASSGGSSSIQRAGGSPGARRSAARGPDPRSGGTRAPRDRRRPRLSLAAAAVR